MTFLDDAKARGLTITYQRYADRLLVSPKSLLTEVDAAFIRANRPAIVQALLLAMPKAEAEFPTKCCGVCPGALSPLCAGCAMEEYRGANGLIYSAWCRESRDIGEPVEVRERGTNKWRKIGEDES